MEIRAKSFVQNRVKWSLIEAVARKLIEAGTLSGREIRETIRQGIRDLCPVPDMSKVSVKYVEIDPKDWPGV